MNEDFKKLSLPIAIVVASVVLGLCIIFSAKLISGNIEKTSNKLRKDLLGDIKKMEQDRAKALRPEAIKPGERMVKGVTAGSNPVMGNPAAPVLVVEFSDFECPFSKKFYQQTFPLIEKEYISTGKVKFAYRDFPLPMHILAKDAAIACRCAGKQNNYWQMFDKLSLARKLDPEEMQNYAKGLKLNMKVFNNCLKDEVVAAEIDNDFGEGSNFGVRGTPAFFINGHFVNGAYPFEAFRGIIEEELSNPDSKK
ncbi:MAG: DsbA family protein [Candidatus Omnitrophota bacterium]